MAPLFLFVFPNLEPSWEYNGIYFFMRLEKWFISNLDDTQRNVIVQSIDKNIVVQGMAGSGKTNLAIHRALQAKDKGSYAIVIMTVALRRMIAYGMDAVGLDKERIAYDWAWENRGFDLYGDVYWKTNKEEPLIVFLVNDTSVRKFEECNSNTKKAQLYGLDFGDWVDDIYYRTFGRRVSWFKEVEMDDDFELEDTDNYQLVPSAILYKPVEKKIDYLIVDEAQDFSLDDYKQRIKPKAKKSLSLFGDSVQQMNSKGNSIDEITKGLKYEPLSLIYNYRLPKAIAKFAQEIQTNSQVDLMSNNLKDSGDSDYPRYPKPLLCKYKKEEDELKAIVARIKTEDLDDVAILVPEESDVITVNEYLEKNGISTQTHYRTGKYAPFRTINTLDFSNNDLPCVLTYYAAKGSEFDNVFIPFASEKNKSRKMTRNGFYVACTRSSKNLFISYTGHCCSFLQGINDDYYKQIDYSRK